MITKVQKWGNSQGVRLGKELLSDVQINVGDAVDVAVDRHLGDCAGCRRFAAELRESQAALKDLADEALDQAALAAVRARVLAELDRPRRWTWAWGFAAVAALLLVLSVVLVRARRPVPLLPPPAVARIPQTVEPQPAPPATQARPVRRARAVRHVPKRVRRPEPAKLAVAHKTEPMVIKFVTDDPNIVVIWLVEGKVEPK